MEKGEKSAWEAWKSFPSVTEALEESPPVFQLLECFTFVLYDKTTSISEVNELRQDLFSQEGKNDGEYSTN